ncbi:amino acid ABC transporter membrane protein, PAAT family [Quadrisphaera granulorum]|uniref:Amino acid ABC transporter membrane protein (PAAT family) n=1 Tax=Quadrisphaera granulorum TaxID=317664 RepID=A0A316AHI3_9ACTN|nr:amino acid ABC transporter permease [Quadrisphaera granulorum]PWJ56394.1 amino acid ABC transporter membrane protein (PAAT family) [Quadrisphaera granulorum]SZE95028.1 amino acid ABC transporter membrane protein, PAAT family [Quadrisphaera granulorum]
MSAPGTEVFGDARGGLLPAPSEVELGRRSYRRSRQRRSTWVALLSTLVFSTLLVVGTVSAPGWPRTQQSFLDPDVARRAFPLVLEGLWLNLRVLVVAAVCVLALGLAVALLRTVRGPVWAPVRFVMALYTDVFRGMPLIVLLYIIGFGVPGLRLQGVPTDKVVLGTTAIVLVYSAYVSEVFRAGIESVHPSQRAAARALGLTHRQTTRLVVLPQAVRNVTPPLLNDLVALQKDVGLISVLGAIDAVRQAQIVSANTGNFTPYIVAALLFVLLAVPTARLADWATARARRRQQAGSVL